MRTQIQHHICNLINANPGINSVKLILKLIDAIYPAPVTNEFFHNCIEELVKDKAIVELEYINPGYEHRVKSMYFKGGTTFPNLQELAVDNSPQTKLATESNRNVQVPCSESKG